MSIVPPYLQKGDAIGIVCPAGFMPYDNVHTCILILQEWGFVVKVGKTVGHQFNYFSGTDAERLDDLQLMLDDADVKAILCARGGYGTGRIIDDLSFKRFKKHPKWIVGFSDVTVLHSHIFSQYKIASLHSPMAAAFNNEGYHNEYVQSLHFALTGVKANYTCTTHGYNKKGRATGKLMGGNLSLLAHLIGTSSDVDTKNKILFLEDVGEYIYNTDRMLYQLKRSGKFDKLAGLIMGGFTNMKDTTTPFGKDAYEAINDVVKDFEFPVSFGFPVSHEKENYALKIGVDYELRVGKNRVTLREV